MSEAKPLSLEQKKYLQSRIQSLRSKQKFVGMFRQAGMQRTIEGMKQQLKTNTWAPHDRSR